MRIENNKSTPANAEASKAQSAKAAASEKAKEKRSGSAAELLGGGASQTAISPQAKDAAKAKSVAMSTSDVREDKVAELKKKIQSGTYKVDADKLASKIVDEHLSTAAVVGG